MSHSKRFIREATRDDIPVLIGFQQKLAKETEHLSLDSDTLTRGTNALFDDPVKGKYFVATEDQSIVGCLMITYEWSEWRNGEIIWIQSVYVDKNFRGRGVFKSLYHHIRAMVENDPSFRGIRLYMEKSNDRAREVYQRLGMSGDHYQVFEWFL